MLGSVRGVVSNDHSYRDEANPRVPTLFRVRKATRFGRTIARSERPGVVEEPGMCRSSLDGNREIPRLASCGAPHQAEHACVIDPMLQETDQPLLADRIEEASEVRSHHSLPTFTCTTCLRAKLEEIKEEMRQRRHHPIPEQGHWLKQVVTGFYAYHGRRHIQTIKQESGESAAVFTRDEWEHQIGGRQPDLDVAQDAAPS